MYKYVKFNEENGLCSEVGTGTNTDFYKSIGMVEKDVEQSEIDGQWYLTEKCPHYSDEEKLQNAKADKLAELSKIADNYDQYKCPIDMYIISSTGFKVDADIRSQANMQGLVLVLPAGGTTRYKDFNNEFQTVSKEQLEVMIAECKQNGLNLYQQKFTYEFLIDACDTLDEVNAIEIKFTMTDFTPKTEDNVESDTESDTEPETETDAEQE